MSDEFFLDAKGVEQRYGMDVSEAESIRSGLIEVTRHMRTTLMKGAFSNVVREILDFGVCVHRVLEDGSTEMVAITEGCSHFAFTHPPMTNMVLDEWGIENLGPGDTLVCNDPWRGSIHYPDVNLFRPVFVEGELAFVLTDASHLVDIGGPVAGGFNNAATTMFEEGVRIPPILITSGDVPVRSTINLILENCRTPALNLGDIRALFGTLKVGETRLRQLIETHGLENVKSGSSYALDLAERRMRSALISVPDGVYESEVSLDDDGRGGDPITIRAKARVVGSECEIDFSGTDRQSLGATTTCWEDLTRCLVGPKVILDPAHPMNAGAMRPFYTMAPPGTLITGLPPTSMSQHSEIGVHLASMMLRLFGQMQPERAVASDSSTSGTYVFQGIDSRPGREGEPFGGITGAGGAWGGTSQNDGISHCISPIFNIACTKVEFFERDTPMLIRGMGGVIDAPGAGEFRSGVSDCTIFECLSGEAEVSSLLDAGRVASPGLNGGGTGMLSYIYAMESSPDRPFDHWNSLLPVDELTPLAGRFDADGNPDPEAPFCDGTLSQTLKLTGWPLKPRQQLAFYMASGGGYGSPLDRDPELVRRDAWNEIISVDFARLAYGVVIDAEGLVVDAAATGELRAELKEAERRSEWTPPVGGFRGWPRDRGALAELRTAGHGVAAGGSV
jgi:N-methylhydantoinase B